MITWFIYLICTTWPSAVDLNIVLQKQFLHWRVPSSRRNGIRIDEFQIKLNFRDRSTRQNAFDQYILFETIFINITIKLWKWLTYKFKYALVCVYIYIVLNPSLERRLDHRLNTSSYIGKLIIWAFIIEIWRILCMKLLNFAWKNHRFQAPFPIITTLNDAFPDRMYV